jgi:GT2 family glycosyltransferase
MDLSVIIVNYNVKYFLEQCLCSLRQAIGSLKAEVIVVDNNSTDGSVAYLSEKFSFARFINNKANEGFAKANNQALELSSGRYILFLNPDTIIPEDCFAQCFSFIQSKPDAGALGIRMIDGSGRFLKESKRGFPSPWVSFCKMSGLTSTFPNSRIFAGYYLGNLSSKKNQKVEALSGAFMLIKKEVLQVTGGFDERFFMYAEDIDLSYRINKAGFSNYYFAESTIIHFKGESTTKDANYLRLFYKAMGQFVQKHYSGLSTKIWVPFLQTGIWLRSSIATFTQSKAGNDSQPIPTQFTSMGDKGSCQEINSRISSVTDSENVVYCTGEQFSYRQLIKEIESRPSGKNIFIHGKGTGSIVSSGSKNEQGIVISTHLGSSNQNVK